MFIMVFSILQREEVFRLALRSDDELFHVSLYEWLFNMNMTDKLLEVRHVYINSCNGIYVLLILPQMWAEV